ncbi:MAG: type II toxin-antitoxin system VapC family toxin [Bryobacterales bacterium]|nr:type II toxin-antitoxin system VapC family toxin [Bryobacterales bacterium]
MSLPTPFLVDTDILIDYLHGHPAAVRLVTDHADRVILSAMSVAELYAGVRGQARDPEQLALADFLELFPIVPVSADIARAGGLYRRDYGRSHGIGLADAVIAATAVSSDAMLMTLNVKHYPMFEGLEAAYRK